MVSARALLQLARVCTTDAEKIQRVVAFCGSFDKIHYHNYHIKIRNSLLSNPYFLTFFHRNRIETMSSEDPTKRKRTMVKDRVGVCRTSTFNLPQSDHVYGYKAKTDDEGAGALISTWVTANPSEHKGAEEIIVYSNVLAIKHGCITARDMRQYAKDHPCIRMKEILTEAAPTAQFEGPFGIKTKFAEEPLTDIIQAR